MKKIVYLILLLQIGVINAQTKTAVSPYGEKITVNTSANNGLTNNNGTLELNGELIKPTTIATTTTNTLKLNGLSTSADTNDKPIAVTADGTIKKAAFPVVNILPSDIGTVIVLNGKLEVAQEISALLAADFPIGTSSPAVKVIPNISNVLIDNKGTFASDGTGNSFTVTADGLYAVTINTQVNNTNNVKGGNPTIGVWCNTDNQWLCKINNETGNDYKVNLTLLTSVTMSASKTYSFRAGYSTNTTATIVAVNSGTTGGGPVSYFSVKRVQ
ncbi:hypothetical protein ACFFLS_24460 [Flavobacterium procerum]|uniref:C1q domain-containing protein n=1 Tax=Flavobacterium procerum TaxID=1455569 RepID=A0ABV6BXS9_9FLAO